MMLRIELDSVWKARNAKEGRRVNRATCAGIEEVGDHEIIGALCRKLIGAGHSGLVEVWRGEIPCFRPVDVTAWANGKVGRGEQPEHLRKARSGE